MGSLLRRVGGSQRGGFSSNDSSSSSSDHQTTNTSSDQQKEQQPSIEKSDKNKGRITAGGSLLRKAKSLRDVGSSSNSNKSKRRQELSPEDTEEASQDQSPTSSKQPSESSGGGGGGFRGMLKRATSLRGTFGRSNSSSSLTATTTSPLAEQGDLEPVFVMTDSTHGKIVFQTLVDDDADNNDDNTDNGCANNNNNNNTSNETQQATHTDDDDDHQGDDHSQSSPSTARTSADEELFMDFSSNEIVDMAETPSDGNDLQQSDNSGGLLGGRLLRNLFMRTKSGRTVSSLETFSSSALSSATTTTTPPIFSSLQEEKVVQSKTSQQSPMQEITLPCLMDQTSVQQRKEVDSTKMVEAASVNLNFMEGLLDVVEQYDEQYTAPLAESSSTEIEEEDYQDESDYAGDDSQDESQDEDDDDDEDHYYESHHLQGCQFDIEVAPMDHADRDYDELEKFYQEETFAHVGGSYLLGKASELMSVPECEEDESGFDRSAASGMSVFTGEEEEQDEDDSIDTGVY